MTMIWSSFIGKTAGAGFLSCRAVHGEVLQFEVSLMFV